MASQSEDGRAPARSFAQNGSTQAPSPHVPLPEDVDAKLVERLVARDERAFNTFVQAYERRIFTLIVRMVGNPAEAEDLAQECFVQVFKAIGTFRGDCKLSTWVYRIAINLCKNRSKYNRVRHASQQDPLDAIEERGAVPAPTVAPIPRPDAMMAGKQIEQIVRDGIVALEPSFRECLVLRDVEDLSYDEIVAITGLPEGTVKSRIHRARAQLRAMVERTLGEEVG